MDHGGEPAPTRKLCLACLLATLVLPCAAPGQALSSPPGAAGNLLSPANIPDASPQIPALPLPAGRLPVNSDLVPARPMAPTSALLAYEQQARLQKQSLGSYIAATMVRAELPDISKWGEFELKSYYTAPKTLEFVGIRFTGDPFVKLNVIARLLRGETDQLRQNRDSVEINESNYKISYRGTSSLLGSPVYVYDVKPRKKRVGLFKGRIVLNAYDGAIVRVEGRMVKSPSFFIRSIDFSQEYVRVGGFTLVAHMHSSVKARFIGRAIVDVYQNDYAPVAAPVAESQSLLRAQIPPPTR